jgi:hypothetical protein
MKSAAAYLAGALALLGGCGSGDRPVQALRQELDGTPEAGTFDPGMVADLPEPARRFLLRAIEPGTPLARSVELEMHGTIRLDADRDPLPMTATQVLAPPTGFVWQARTAGGLMRIRGYDRYGQGEGEMRWHLWGLIPVMRATGEDTDRSAAGRLAMEAVLLPSALLPQRGARWEAVDDSTARFHLTVGRETVATTLRVDAEGRPVRASAMRWRGDAGPGGGYVRFDVEMEGEASSDGYRIPARVQAGWELGEPDEFRFFDATLDRVTFR